MKRSQLFFSVSALLGVSLLASCTLFLTDGVKEKEAAARAAWYEKHRPHFSSGPRMSVVGYEIVPVHGSRKDRGELSINNRLGVGAEIPAPRVVLRNPARRSPSLSEQPAVMQLKSSPRQRVLEEVIF